ncbi:MAG: PAS domain S-box protein [Candidatus Glassbacteria bacterium]|nr:PAS domain S-box protein [Candidatus Glassbacteria bacterium]
MKETKPSNRDCEKRLNLILSESNQERSNGHAFKSKIDFLDKIINGSLNIIIAVDQERKIVEFNNAAQVAFGYSKKEILGKPIDQLYSDPSEGEKIAGQIRKDGAFQGRVVNRRKDGEDFVCMLSASALRSDNGEIIGVVGNSRDITEELKAETALKESEETARILLNSPADSIVLLDTSGTILDLNESAIRALAAEDEAPIGQSIFELLGEKEREILRELVESCVQSNMPAKYESERDVRLLGDAKFKVRFNNALYPIRDESGRVGRLAMFSSELADERSRIPSDSIIKKSGVEDELFKTTVKQLPGIIWCVDKELSFTLSDGLGLAGLGLKPGKVVGMSLFEFFQISDPNHEYLVKHRQALAGAIVNMEATFNSIVYSCSISPLRNEHGKIIGALGIAFDITARKQLEQAIRKEKETYRELVENIDETVFSLDCAGRFTYISPAIEPLLGYTPDEVIGREFYSYLFEEDLPGLVELYRDVLNGQAKTHEMRLPSKIKEPRWVRISAKPIYGDGGVAGISGIIFDITARKSAQIALQESERKYLNLVENLPVGMFRTTLEPDGRFIMANRATANMLGFDSTDDLIGTLVTDRYFDAAERSIFLAKAVKAGEVVEQEEQLRKADGTPIWCMITGRAVKDNTGVFMYFDGIIVDITSRKTAEEKLLISENRFESIAEGSDDWIWEIGANLRIRYTNARVKDIIGYEPKDVIGKSLLDFMYEKDMDPGRYENEYTLLSEQIFSGHQTILRHKKGKKVITESSGVPIFRRDRSFVGFQGLTKDITENILIREKEELQRQQLIQADKMISLGILVSGVAHEINNPNQFIMINIPLLKRAWESIEPILDKYYQDNGDFPLGGISYSTMKPKIPELFSGIYNGSQRIKNIVKSLKGYAREGQPEEKNQLSVNDVIQSALVILTNLTKNSTDNLKVNLGNAIPPVMGNFQRLEQVLINLIQNACQALDNPQKGIEIKSEYVRNAEKVVIVIRDEGVGIKKRNMKYILDPFFTSRRDSGGSGLGLSISAGIINDHNGTMEFKSVPGKGTTAIINLPVFKAGS